ncbi:uncharacterized protein LOC111069152 [Drosophila obscura]|uniref:uncharacterized protein LOC111069152 n=1 Tax=Drosophila obscura TaxID=7282 RepID=UPI001BB25754|nr:uncharacterized protein LOC111069152 [Drosophila obscura]
MTQSDDTQVQRIKIKLCASNCYYPFDCVREYKMKLNSNFKKLAVLICREMRMPYSLLRFHFEGKRIRPTHTPESLGMENGDTVDILTMQGGSLMDSNSVKDLFGRFLLHQGTLNSRGKWQLVKHRGYGVSIFLPISLISKCKYEWKFT